MNYQQFSTYDNMISSKHKYQEGQMAYVADTKKAYQYKDGSWQEIIVKGGGVEVSLYDMNKQIISQLPALSNDTIQEKIALINQLTKQTLSNYYMLLCKDISYYTLFINDSNSKADFGIEVIECAKHLGQIKSIEFTEDQTAIEIWFTNNEDSYVMYLFNYENGVILCTM